MNFRKTPQPIRFPNTHHILWKRIAKYLHLNAHGNCSKWKNLEKIFNKQNKFFLKFVQFCGKSEKSNTVIGHWTVQNFTANWLHQTKSFRALAEEEKSQSHTHRMHTLNIRKRKPCVLLLLILLYCSCSCDSFGKHLLLWFHLWIQNRVRNVPQHGSTGF